MASKTTHVTVPVSPQAKKCASGFLFAHTRRSALAQRKHRRFHGLPVQFSPAGHNTIFVHRRGSVSFAALPDGWRRAQTVRLAGKSTPRETTSIFCSLNCREQSWRCASNRRLLNSGCCSFDQSRPAATRPFPQRCRSSDIRRARRSISGLAQAFPAGVCHPPCEYLRLYRWRVRRIAFAMKYIDAL